MIGYIEDGPNLVTMAMNGWDEGHPAWWLNLEANPDAAVRLAHEQPRSVRARAASGAERDQLWKRWSEIDTGSTPMPAAAPPSHRSSCSNPARSHRTKPAEHDRPPSTT
jgi:deazaflavin-dependent oxidoreductase (nitroreductase family)